MAFYLIYIDICTFLQDLIFQIAKKYLTETKNVSKIILGIINYIFLETMAFLIFLREFMSYAFLLVHRYKYFCFIYDYYIVLQDTDNHLAYIVICRCLNIHIRMYIS